MKASTMGALKVCELDHVDLAGLIQRLDGGWHRGRRFMLRPYEGCGESDEGQTRPAPGGEVIRGGDFAGGLGRRPVSIRRSARAS